VSDKNVSDKNVSDKRNSGDSAERRATDRANERQASVRQATGRQATEWADAEGPAFERHPELDYAFAPNLAERHPINRQSACRPNGEFKSDVSAAVADARQVRGLTLEERRTEDLKYALK
jgi:hypothetical protein